MTKAYRFSRYVCAPLRECHNGGMKMRMTKSSYPPRSLLSLLVICLLSSSPTASKAERRDQIRSVWVYRGRIRVWQRPTHYSEQRGMIAQVGRFAVSAVLPPGGGCPHRWYKLGPEAYACSGWLIPSSKPPTKLPLLLDRYQRVARVVSHRPVIRFYKTPGRILRGRAEVLKGLLGFGVVGRRVIREQVYLETMEGGWIPQAVARAPSTSLVGVNLTRQSHLPIAFVTARSAKVWTLRRDSADPAGSALPRYTVRRSFGRVELAGRCFHRIGNGKGLACKAVAVADRPPPPPKQVGKGEMWLDLDTSEAILYARKGRRVVRVMLASLSDRTPKGIFRIDSKHISMTLRNQSHDDPWYLEQVPYVAFFHEGFAIHAAYWHDEFGTLSTHGCVNLSPTDARWVFARILPKVPPGYVRITSTPRDPGTLVRVRGGPRVPAKAAGADGRSGSAGQQGGSPSTK